MSVWESLLDPQTFIPSNIQKLTGISQQMVSGQSCFEDLAAQIKKALRGSHKDQVVQLSAKTLKIDG